MIADSLTPTCTGSHRPTGKRLCDIVKIDRCLRRVGTIRIAEEIELRVLKEYRHIERVDISLKRSGVKFLTEHRVGRIRQCTVESRSKLIAHGLLYCSVISEHAVDRSGKGSTWSGEHLQGVVATHDRLCQSIDDTLGSNHVTHALIEGIDGSLE